MPGDMINRRVQFNMQMFHAHRDERPKEEKWELIDGTPTMMPPPTLMHQRICANLDRLLNARLEATKPDWRADREVGLLLPKDDKFNPEPDVTIIDAKIGAEQIYAERFYFVCEVLSRNDKKWVLDGKVIYYRAHELNNGILFVRQDSVVAILHSRAAGGQSDGQWHERRLVDAGGPLDLPAIGVIGRLGDLYRHTPLDPWG